MKWEKPRTLASGFVLLCLGFFAGRRASPAIPAASSAVQEPSALANVNTAVFSPISITPTAKQGVRSPQAPAVDKAPLLQVAVPERVLANLLVSPLQDYEKGTVDLSSLLMYGFSLEETKALAEIINRTTARIRQLELDRSKLITEADGEQYFLIPPFPGEGALLQKQLNADIASLCAALPDDREKLLQYALARYRPFSNFGADKLEWAIQTSPPDSPDRNAYSFKRYLKGGGVVTELRSMALKSYSSQFQALVDHHLRFYLQK